MSSSQTVAEISIGVNLIDDYLYVEEAPVGDSLDGRFLTVQNSQSGSTASELLTVNPEEQLVRLYPDSESDSGWNTETVSVTPPGAAEDGATISRLAAFYQDHLLNALVYFENGTYDEVTGTPGSSAVWLQSTGVGEWSEATLASDAANALEYTFQTDLYVDDDGNSYFYGVTGGIGTGAFFLVAYDSSEGEWVVIWEQLLSQFSPAISEGAAFRMTAGSGEDQFTILWVNDDVIYHQGASIVDGTFAWADGDPKAFDPDVGTITVDGLFGIPGELGSANILLLDDSGVLYLIQGFDEDDVSMTALTGDSEDGQPESASSISVGSYTDSESGETQLILFAVETSSASLWYAPQSGSSPLGFGSWVNVAGTNSVIASPTSMIYGPELFSVDLDNSVFHTARSLTDQVWGTSKIANPSADTSSDPTNAATYSMTLTALDADGNVVPNTLLDVSTTDQAATILVDNVSHNIGPSTSIEIETDAGGQVAVVCQAVNLKPPQILFTVVDSDSGDVQRWCQGDIVQQLGDTAPTQASESVSNRLQNNDPSRPVTNSALQESITENGVTIPALMSADYDPSSSGDAASAIIAAGGWVDANNIDADGTIKAEKLATPHWEIDFTRTEGPRFRQLSQEEGRALVERCQTSGAARLGSSNIFGDVARYFKHEWNALKKFSATVVEGELQIIFNEAESFVISTVKQAGAALETIFSRIAEIADDIYQMVQNVIEWLKMLFEWDDILNTHNVLKACFTSTLQNVQDTIQTAEDDLDGWFDQLKTTIADGLTKIESTPDFNQSFNSFANSADSSGLFADSGNVLTNAEAQSAQTAWAGKTCYVSNKANTYYTSLGSDLSRALSMSSLQDDSGTQAILDAFTENIWGQSGYTEGLASIETFFDSSVEDPSKFFDALINAFLTCGVDLVEFLLSAIEAVLNAVLDGVDDAIVAAIGEDGDSGFLNEEIDLPVLTWLYENVIAKGSKLTLLDLICLMLAVPATVLYKLIYGAGKAPFSSSDASTIASEGLPWPDLTALATGRTTTPGAGVGISSTLLEVLGVVGGLLSIPQIVIAPALDMWAAEEEWANMAAALCFWGSCASLTVVLIQQGVSAPYGLFEESSSDWSEADRATVALWGMTFLPWACDLVFTFSPQKAVTKFAAVYGPGIDTILHWIVLGTGTWAAIEQSNDWQDYSNWSAINCVIAPLPGCAAVFITDPPEGPLVTAGYDVVTDIGAGVTGIGTAVSS